RLALGRARAGPGLFRTAGITRKNYVSHVDIFLFDCYSRARFDEMIVRGTVPERSAQSAERLGAKRAKTLPQTWPTTQKAPRAGEEQDHFDERPSEVRDDRFFPQPHQQTRLGRCPDRVAEGSGLRPRLHRSYGHHILD